VSFEFTTSTNPNTYTQPRDSKFPNVSLQSFAEVALAKGVRLVVITRGDDRAQGWTNSDSVSLPADKVSVVDTVGASDTF
jgi:fructokinase